MFILGDFAFANKNQWKNILQQLNGKKHLILGNHDRAREIPEECFETISDIMQLSVKYNDKWETFILSHRPFLCWEGSEQGVYHLFGHMHSYPESTNTYTDNALHYRPMYDVGVDNNNYRPVSLETVLYKLNNKTHGHSI